MFTPGTMLLHDTLDPRGQNLWFTAPQRVLVARTGPEIADALAQLALDAHAVHALLVLELFKSTAKCIGGISKLDRKRIDKTRPKFEGLLDRCG